MVLRRFRRLDIGSAPPQVAELRLVLLAISFLTSSASVGGTASWSPKEEPMALRRCHVFDIVPAIPQGLHVTSDSPDVREEDLLPEKLVSLGTTRLP